MECVHVATLNIPASVVPQIIQHLDDGMFKYHEALMLGHPTPLSVIAGVLLGVHFVLTLFVGDNVASVACTSVIVFALWSLHVVTSEFESPAGVNRDLRKMHTQLNDRLVSLVGDTTVTVPRLTLQSEEARERLQDHSLRDCEFHQKLLRTLKFGAQSWTRPTHKIEAQRISSPNEVLFTAISAASVVPASAVGMSSRLGEILTSIVHIVVRRPIQKTRALPRRTFQTTTTHATERTWRRPHRRTPRAPAVLNAKERNCLSRRGGLKSSPTSRSVYSRSSTPSRRRRATCYQEQGSRSRENTGSPERSSWSCRVAVSCGSVRGSNELK